MTPHPLVDSDLADAPTLAPWKPAHALGWSVAASVVLAGSAKLGLALRGEPFEGVLAPAWGAPGIGAGCGLGAALLIAVACGLTLRAATVLTLLAVAVGAAAAWAAAFLQPFRWAEPEDSFLAAFALVGLLGGVIGYTASRHFPSVPKKESESAMRTAAAWQWSKALAWAAAGAIAFGVCGALTLPLRGHAFEGTLLVPLESLGIGAGSGFVAGLVVSVVRGLSSSAAVVLTLIACVAGGASELLAPVLAETAGGSKAGYLAAFVLVGLLAGFVGYAASRRFTVESPEDDYSPRVLLPTPGLRVVLMALLFVVAAIVGAPSGVGWLVLAVGGFGLVVALALVGQERRIAELEQRLRRLEDAQAGEDAKEGSGSPPELD